MYLKSIEVQGFKSFANKIRFEFHNGITAIVGPNGSGKSNVSDAVRWVLGEQSAKSLRGGSMQDVIFAGTELRKPQGFAYVAITLDNTDRALSVDYDEVKVSRRLYRSGESEYQINDSPCRLRDVNELFFDTGIGQEGYSIIGQGQIEQILSGKSEDRRELFDEAAGITKFRKRKALAERKLENERASMVRVSDILSELEKQVEPLRRQAETAREYLALREELKLYDLNLFLSEAGTLKEDLKTLGERETVLADDEAAAEEELAGLKTQYEALDETIRELDDTISGLRDAISSRSLEEESAEGEIRVLLEQINTDRANQEHITSRLSAIGGEIAGREAEEERLKGEKSGTDEKAGEASRNADDAEWRLVSADEEIQLLEQNIQKKKDEIIEDMEQKAQVTARDQRFVTLLEQLNAQEADSARRLLEIRTEEAELEKETGELKQTIGDIDEKRDMIARAERDAREDAFAADQEVTRLGALLQKAQAAYQADSARLESLKNLAERYDGYGNSIRRVMETRGRIRGIHGVVADLIRVEHQYETAIETALGGKIQNVVTDSEETAKQLIEHLKRNRYGRATFLPLTSVNRATEWDPGSAGKEPGVIGPASGLVDSDPQYRGLVRALLGRDLVVDTIDHAIAIARKYHYAFRIVTLEGELLNPGGSMSGGAFKNSSNLLGRKREIEELTERVEKLLRQSEKTESEQNAARKKRAESREELERLKEADQTLQLEKNTAELNLKRIEEKAAELRAQSGTIGTERNRYSADREQIARDRGAVAEELQQLDSEREQKEQEIRDLTASLEEQRTARESLADAQKSAQLLAQSERQKAVFLEESLMRLAEELKKLREEQEALTDGTAGAAERISEKELQIQNIREKTGELRRERQELSETLEKKTAEKSGHDEERKKYFDRRNETESRRSALDKDLFRLRGQLERLREKLSERTAYVQSEYSLTEEGARQFYREDLGKPAQMRKEIEQRKAKIRGLGNVNVNAIEDYRVTNERYVFLKGQHEDLKKAEASLVQVITELDQGMRRQFSREFGRIAEQFNLVFRDLFGGGKGELKLEEGADILEASISIIAQPPGKKLQNMMQLSGGEKALTAISLLFAIQNLKPSPFALLDEIEAALDDSNVDRYAQYLKKLTVNTQFIVITHRRGTMVGADRLYGITMQEKGVSTLVSVSLIEDKLDQ